jgi:hypothetical protein
MSALGKWWARLAAMVGTVVLAVFVPAAAWASSGTGEVVVEAARRRTRSAGGGLGLLCCLVVIGVIALVVYLIVRNRNRKGPR